MISLKKLSSLFFSALFLIYTGGANAMTCMEYDNDIKAFPVIFKGKVISTTTLEQPRNVEMGSIASMTAPGNLADKKLADLWIGKFQFTKFQVIESYKGNLGSEVEIFHQSESMMGTSYKERETYLIFARRDKDGRVGIGNFCDPKYIFSELEKNDKQPLGFLQLQTFKAKAKEFEAMIANQHNRPDLYLEQAKFYEDYTDYPSAEKAYKIGIEKNFVRHCWQIEHEKAPKDSLDEYTWPENASYVEGYGRVLYLQEKYNEALTPLKAIATEEAARLYKAALVKLNKFNELKDSGLDFSGIEVKELDLSNRQLEGANLSKSKIQNLILHNTNLNNANFSGAEVDMDVKNAQFKNANFSDSKTSGDISNSTFENANFSNANWTFGHIKDASFLGANLSKAKLTIYNEITNTDMSKANFEGAYVQRLAGVKIEGANLNHINTNNFHSYHSEFSSVDLSGYNLSNGDFRSVNLKDAKLVGTNLSGADLSPWSEPADLRGVDLTKANLSQAKLFFALYDCQTKFPNGFSALKSYMIPMWDDCNSPRPDISFVGLELPPNEKNWGGFLRLQRHGSPELEKVDLEGVSFESSNIGMVSCKECNLRGVDFSNIDIIQLSFKESDLRGAKFQNIKLDPQSAFDKSDLRGADLSGIAFKEKKYGDRFYYQPSIKGSVYDDTTVWPKSFSPEKAGAVKVY
ncbi:MAG: pentapeptide repeat-containing protein [Pseudobdellovibrionaceae bacterium]